MNALKVALAVQNCILGNFEQNLKNCLFFINDAADKGAEIIAFPEMNLTGYTSNNRILDVARQIDNTVVDPFSEIARKAKITILAGLAEKSDQTLYATHLVFFPDGTYGSYRKIHTAPFEKKYFTPGNDISVFNASNICFGLQLCYDAHFPELTLSMSLKGVDMVFIPHASPRGTPVEKCESWMRHLRTRAFDNAIFIAACNQTGNNATGLFFPGISLVIGPDGNVLYESVNNIEELHVIDLDMDFLKEIRSHKMKYFLPNRRNDLFNGI